MTDTSLESIISRALEIGAKIQRPKHFTNHEHCCECQEHDEELQPFTPATVTREALGHMGWDPITFCTDEGFRYFLPGLIRVALTEKGEDCYFDQFLFQLNCVGKDLDRHAICSEPERAIVAEALNWLVENRAKDIEDEMCTDDLFHALARWSA